MAVGVHPATTLQRFSGDGPCIASRTPPLPIKLEEQQQPSCAAATLAAAPAPCEPAPPTSPDGSDFRVADLVDMHCGPYGSTQQQNAAAQVLHPDFRNFGGGRTFYGRVTTMRLTRDSNTLLRTVLQEDGTGRVLVVDNGASMRCACLGDVLATLAHKSGWAGIVVNGCVRDVAQVARIPVGIQALASNPMKPGKGAPGLVDAPVDVGGVTIRPGNWLFADEDGILVSPEQLPLPSKEEAAQLAADYLAQ
ncbi:hypothetical protein CHLNCDRAFT_133045 [Chlorella variabilis]|uniref:4-hydroxy-4-methyl-2-oxoglutarate aldolase n=1 Tax=Chlorella variabilis TaxID=554065 RepID=E1Z282_CHLVA|nr:hypothetical protein CHLNCDRAFT_133045 [Chlorella variabilis]EFN59956.1 hypothetical protein CHLNCDRAFT_133045 [Chlorella variabilis]|eukprot:XP_005852058.1 hypothetical protein CHLNCDRAFT_133045 [Chlorella variabilis]